MRIALVGTRSFGIAALEGILADGHDVAAVFTPEGDRLHQYVAHVRKLPWYAKVFEHHIAPLGLDVIIAAHSHDFIGTKSRAATKLGAFGYHPSLLPLHRGKDAVRWTVRDRDRVAGGSTYWLDGVVDGGPIAAQEWCFVRPEWTANDLWAEELFPMGVRLIRRTLKDLDSGVIVAVPQDDALATVEPSWDAPRLHRPELPAIGAGPVGFKTVASRQDAHFGVQLPV